MERELIPDYHAEEFYRRLIPESIFEGAEKSGKDHDRCVIYCKKVGPDVFSIQGGLAFITEEGNHPGEGVHMRRCPTETFFIFK